MANDFVPLCKKEWPPCILDLNSSIIYKELERDQNNNTNKKASTKAKCIFKFQFQSKQPRT